MHVNQIHVAENIELGQSRVQVPALRPRARHLATLSRVDSFVKWDSDDLAASL